MTDELERVPLTQADLDEIREAARYSTDYLVAVFTPFGEAVKVGDRWYAVSPSRAVWDGVRS